MPETSLDVISSALEVEIPAALGELSSPEGAVTVLFGELANVQELRAALAPEPMASLLADQSMIVARVAGLHRGEIARLHEDGFMLAFDSAHAGLHCAIDLQRAVAAMPAELAERTPGLRIGVHTGAVITGGEDLYGRNVLLGARIAGAAEAGEILASAKTREYTESDPGFTFTERGERHFKGLHGEHELFSVAW